MRGSGALLYELAAAHSRCAVGVLERALLAVPMPVLVVVLASLVFDSTNRAENTSLPISGSVQKYTSDTNVRTTNETTTNREDYSKD